MKNLFIIVLVVFVTQIGFGQDKVGIKSETIVEGLDSIIHNYNPLGELTETKHFKNGIPFERIEYNYWKDKLIEKDIYSNREISDYKMDTIYDFVEDEWGDPTIPRVRYGPVIIENTNRIIFDSISSCHEQCIYPFGKKEIRTSTGNLYGYHSDLVKTEILSYSDSALDKSEVFFYHNEPEFTGDYDSLTIMVEDEWGDPTIPNVYTTPHFKKREVKDSVPSIITTFKYDNEKRLIEKRIVLISKYDGEDEFIKANSEQIYLYQYNYLNGLKNEKIFWNEFLKETKNYKDELLIEKIEHLSNLKQLKYNYTYKKDKKGNITAVIENGKVIKTINYDYFPLSNLGGKSK